MIEPKIIHVDAAGRDAEGNDFTKRASREDVEAGLCINAPVCLRYPDGREVDGVEVRLTLDGITRAALSVLRPEAEL